MPTMAFDWDFLRGNIDKMDEEGVELLYDQIYEMNPENIEDVHKLRIAFKAAQQIMVRKAVEADAALEELEAYVAQTDEGEVESLRKELQLYKSTASGSMDAIEEVKELRSKLQESGETVEKQTREVTKLRKKLEDSEKKLQLNDRQLESLQNEIDSLKDELENSRYNLQDYLVESQQPVEKIRKKNKQIQNLLDELNSMESVNVDLANQVKELKQQLNSATSDIKTAGDELESFRDQLNEVQEMNNVLLKDKENLLKELDVFRREVKEEREKEASLVDKYDEKLDILKEKIREQQEEMNKLEKRLREEETVQLSGSSLVVNSEKLALVQDLQVKQEQIGYLQHQLDEAVCEIESQNEMIENLLGTKREDAGGRRRKRSNIGKASSTAHGKEEDALLEQQLHNLRNKIDHLEDELRCKDEELHELITIKTAYERGEYGLPEALNDIKSLKKIVKQKDEGIEELIRDLNELHEKVDIYREQIEDMKAITQFTENLSNQENIDQENSDNYRFNLGEKLKMLRLQQTIVRLEDEKIALQEELRQRKTMMRDDFIGSSVMNERNIMMTLPLDDERKQVIQHMKQLENENKQLQLGMKEILTGLRESDSQSDVIIDCPSLERLVQLLESRSLNVDLTNVIALKAELDLLRGHNQQIRMELKRLRQQHLKLIGDYSNEILNKKSNESNDSDSKTADNGYHQFHTPHLDSQSDTILGVGGRENGISPDKLETDEMMQCVGRNEKQMVRDNQSGNGDKLETDAERRNHPANGDSSAERIEISRDDIKVENNYDAEIGQDNSEIKNDDNRMLDIKDEAVLPIPLPRQSLIRFRDEEIQTDAKTTTDKTRQDSSCQTEHNFDNQLSDNDSSGCKRCSKLLEYVTDIKNHIEKLASSIRISEESYVNQIESLQVENERLQKETESLREEKKKVQNASDNLAGKQIIELNSQILGENYDPRQAVSQVLGYSQLENYGDYKYSYGKDTPVRMRKTLAKVLETILWCLQQRIEQKDAAIKEYENLMKKSHESYHSELKHLLDSGFL